MFNAALKMTIILQHVTAYYACACVTPLLLRVRHTSLAVAARLGQMVDLDVSVTHARLSVQLAVAGVPRAVAAAHALPVTLTEGRVCAVARRRAVGQRAAHAAVVTQHALARV